LLKEGTSSATTQQGKQGSREKVGKENKGLFETDVEQESECSRDRKRRSRGQKGNNKKKEKESGNKKSNGCDQGVWGVEKGTPKFSERSFRPLVSKWRVWKFKVGGTDGKGG